MKESPRLSASPARLTTGVPGLDDVLQGGIVPAAVYIIQGSPGAGKTILANQMCFHRAAKGAQCLYVTLLAESHDRMIEHLKHLSYFNNARVSDEIYYESAYGTLEEEGLDGILRMLTRERKIHDPALIVLDGLFILEETASSQSDFRRFVNNLSSFAHLTGSTILLLTNSARTPRSPEYTMVDGWIELGSTQMEYESYRYIQVHKFRGSGFIPGQHFSNITNNGIEIYPRLESIVGLGSTSATIGSVKISTGVSELDEMLAGGVQTGSATLLAGPTGIGKTTFGLEFISQSTLQEPGLIFGLYETEASLIDQSAALGIDLATLIQDGAVEVLWRPATENRLDELGHQLVAAVRRRKVKRLFVDGINAFHQSAFYPRRIGRFFTALTNALRAEGVTTLYTLETEELMGGELGVKSGTISAVAQNILLLRYEQSQGETQRTVSIIKVRTSQFDATIRKFFITNQGIVIRDRLMRTEKVCSEDADSGHSERGI